MDKNACFPHIHSLRDIRIYICILHVYATASILKPNCSEEVIQETCHLNADALTFIFNADTHIYIYAKKKKRGGHRYTYIYRSAYANTQEVICK